MEGELVTHYAFALYRKEDRVVELVFGQLDRTYAFIEGEATLLRGSTAEADGLAGLPWVRAEEIEEAGYAEAIRAWHASDTSERDAFNERVRQNDLMKISEVTRRPPRLRAV